MSSTRANKMILTTPDYYHYSALFRGVQEAIAADLDSSVDSNPALVSQLYIPTATWGLKYWEQVLGIVMVDAEDYETRRSRVLAKWRGIGNFSADLIKSIALAFTGEQVNVLVDVSQFLVIVEVPEEFPNQAIFRAEVDNIIHAHLGIRYRTKYHFVAHNDINHILTQHITNYTRMRFWNKDPTKDRRWNGAYSFNGLAPFGQGMVLAQQHEVKIYPVLRSIGKVTGNLTQLWNSSFTFGGGRTFGDFTPSSELCNNAVKVLTIKSGIAQGVTVL